MYPLKFEPIYKQYIWGGNRIKEKLNREIESETAAEAWDISCRDDAMSIVSNGEFRGMSFESVLNKDRTAYLGKNICDDKTFPLLIKIIDACDNLSIQVHPSDEYAQLNENYPFGKTEMWYVIDAPADAFLIIGLKEGVNKEAFKKAIDDETVEDILGKVYIKAGDVINIPSGLIHAITSGVMIAEIQQNSDITYRVYDYNRVDAQGASRPLHIQKALDTADFEGKIKSEILKGLKIVDKDNSIVYYIANKYFAIEKHIISAEKKYLSDENKFFIFTCVVGECIFIYNDMSIELKNCESIFIPATLGEFKIVGNCELLKSYIPQIDTDIITPLLNNGFNKIDILERTGIEFV